jgi:hypothetical protein
MKTAHKVVKAAAMKTKVRAATRHAEWGSVVAAAHKGKWEAVEKALKLARQDVAAEDRRAAVAIIKREEASKKSAREQAVGTVQKKVPGKHEEPESTRAHAVLEKINKLVQKALHHGYKRALTRYTKDYAKKHNRAKSVAMAHLKARKYITHIISKHFPELSKNSPKSISEVKSAMPGIAPHGVPRPVDAAVHHSDHSIAPVKHKRDDFAKDLPPPWEQSSHGPWQQRQQQQQQRQQQRSKRKMAKVTAKNLNPSAMKTCMMKCEQNDKAYWCPTWSARCKHMKAAITSKCKEVCTSQIAQLEQSPDSVVDNPEVELPSLFEDVLALSLQYKKTFDDRT